MDTKHTPQSEYQSPKLPIRRVASIGEAWLELKGTILLYHRRSWAGSSSMFVPVEWVEVHHELRHDWRRLWRGIVAVLLAFLFSLPLTVLLIHQPEHPWAPATTLGLSALMALSCGLGVYFLLSFVRPRAVAELRIADEPGTMKIVFWHRAGRNRELDKLLQRLKGFHPNAEDKIPFPVRMKHAWYKPRLYRIAIAKGLGIGAILYLALCATEVLVWLGQIPPLNNWVYLCVIVPPVFYVLQQALETGIISDNPREYIRAIRAYLKGDLQGAITLLEQTLHTDPNEDNARLLLVQILSERYEFDEATRHCQKLSQEHPDLATHLQANIWNLRRMHERMGGDSRSV